MFDHVTIRVSDPEASERFYEIVLATIALDRTKSGEWLAQWGDFRLATPEAGRPVTRGLHIGFGADSRERVDAFWRAGVDAGFESDGEPGPRSEYGDDYYGGFLLDQDGNSAEAVHFQRVRRGVDHLWIRVADVGASKRFYETVAPHAGIRLSTDTPERAQFVGRSGSFSVLTGDHVTEAAHMGFRTSERGDVGAFHRAAIEAGYRDRAGPGERWGHYSAIVLDPDGHDVEVRAG